MGQTITQRELRNESGQILRRLDQGETLIVTRNGAPVGELAPLRRHRFVAADTVMAIFRNAPTVNARRFREDLDAVASQDVKPRGWAAPAGSMREGLQREEDDVDVSVRVVG